MRRHDLDTYTREQIARAELLALDQLVSRPGTTKQQIGRLLRRMEARVIDLVDPPPPRPLAS